MIIGNTNSYLKNLYVHSSNNKFATIENKKVNTNPKDDINQQIKRIKTQLSIVQNSEEEIQSRMLVLQEKKTGLNNINDIGNQLKDLAEKYKKSDLNENDKYNIEKKASDLLKNLDSIINTDNSSVGDKIIKLTGSDGKSNIIYSKGIDITLDSGKIDDTKPINAKDYKHFSSNVDIKTLLKDSSIIEERISKPVQTIISSVHDSQSIVYNSFMKEYLSATDSIDKLFNMGGISAYERDLKMFNQTSMYISMSGSNYGSSK